MSNAVQEEMEVGLGVKSFENIIPRLRDKRGNPIPRHYVSCPTLITPDPEALLETARAFADSPQEGVKLYPWLKSRSALATDANMRQIRDQLYARIEKGNDEICGQILPLQQQLSQSDALVAKLASEALPLAANLGLVREPGQQLLPFLSDEPVSLEGLAGELSVPAPRPAAGWFDKIGYKLMCAVGGGSLFGLSLGLLSDKIELVNLSEEWPIIALFVLLGVMLMTIIGGVVSPVMGSIGDAAYRRGIRTISVETAALILKLIFVAAFVWAAIIIESKVEQLGLLKVVTESVTLKGTTISKEELRWVSLMLVVPVIGLYIISGLMEGERRANLAFLMAEQGKRRKAIAQHPRFSSAVAGLEALRTALVARGELKARIEQLEGQLRDDLSIEEKRQLEDLQMDVITHSQDAEKALLALVSDTRRAGPSKDRGWTRFFRLPSFLSRGRNTI